MMIGTRYDTHPGITCFDRYLLNRIDCWCYYVARIASGISDPTLYDEVKRLDAVLSEAFNKHDVNKLKSLFADDLEFYQDNEGLVRYQQTLRDFESMFAQGNNMTRELVGNTLEVYPVKDYGAIEIGAHRFCHVENGKNECGTFRFVHIWQKKDGEWKISRAISYSH